MWLRGDDVARAFGMQKIDARFIRSIMKPSRAKCKTRVWCCLVALGRGQ